MQAFFDWLEVNSAVLQIVLAAATLVVAVYFGLRSPTIRKRLGLKVRRSERVDVSATDRSEADIDVGRSKDVKVRIGDDAAPKE